MKQFLTLSLASFLLFTTAACSSGENTTSNANTTNAPTANRNSANANAPTAPATSNNHGGPTTDETPASVRAAISDAQTFTTQHRDIPQATVTEVERETGASITDRDHHAYLAFSTTGGARRQVGAATVIQTDAGEMVIVYDSRNGMPVIREIRTSSANVPAAFLDQFKGKTHDDAVTLGRDIHATGSVSEAQARSITTAVKRDVLIMQALYGAAHSH